MLRLKVLSTQDESGSSSDYRTTIEALRIMDAKPGRVERSMNAVDDRILDLPQGNSSGGLKDAIGDEALTALKDKLDGFVDKSLILMKALDEVAKVHPFVSVAVLAFKAAVILELKRRGNERRVTALYEEMREMMSTICLLQDITADQLDSTVVIREKMRNRLKDVATDIEECANACDIFQKKRLLVRVLSSVTWELKLSDYAAAFSDHRSAIKRDLSVLTAAGVKAANNTLGNVKDLSSDSNEKLNLILLFRQLQSPHERTLTNFITAKGGAELCLKDDTIFKELITLAYRRPTSSTTTKNPLDNSAAARSQADLGQYNVHGGSPWTSSSRFTSPTTSPYAPLGPMPAVPYYHSTPRDSPGAALSLYPSENVQRSPYSSPSAFPPTSTPQSYPPLPTPPMTSSPLHHPSLHAPPITSSPLRYPPAPTLQSLPLSFTPYPGPYDPGADGFTVVHEHNSPDNNVKQRPALDTNNLLRLMRRELEENIEALLQRNFDIFRPKFKEQQNQLNIEDVSAIGHSEGDRIIKVVKAGPHDRILNPVIQHLWGDMEWKSSVKTKHFIMALYDFYMLKKRSPIDALAEAEMRSRLYPTDGSQSRDLTHLLDMADEWALQYIHVTHLQQLMEAFDDDASGYVSILEVNTFTGAIYKDWSLPRWIAYWAVGFQLAMYRYFRKIVDLLHLMYRSLERILPTNTVAVSSYLYSRSISTLNTILAGIEHGAEDLRWDDELYEKFKDHVEAEERRLESNLDAVKYILDGRDTVALVAGDGRLEKYLMPLLYLLMKRHYQVMVNAEEQTIDRRELLMGVASLDTVWETVSDRYTVLEKLWKRPLGEDYFENFTHGIYSRYRDGEEMPYYSFGDDPDFVPDPQHQVEVDAQASTGTKVLYFPGSQDDNIEALRLNMVGPRIRRPIIASSFETFQRLRLSDEPLSNHFILPYDTRESIGPGRRRWIFAVWAIKLILDKKPGLRLSKSSFLQRRMCRWNFVPFYVRREDLQSTQYKLRPLSQHEEGILALMEHFLDVSEIQHYRFIGLHNLRRDGYHYNYCAVCGFTIVGTRYLSILPTTQTSLCSDCYSSTTELLEGTPTPSIFRLRSVVPSAGNVIKMSSEQARTDNSLKWDGECDICHRPVDQGAADEYWMCLICEDYTAVCMECDTKDERERPWLYPWVDSGRTFRHQSHTMLHPMQLRRNPRLFDRRPMPASRHISDLMGYEHGSYRNTVRPQRRGGSFDYASDIFIPSPPNSSDGNTETEKYPNGTNVAPGGPQKRTQGFRWSELFKKMTADGRSDRHHVSPPTASPSSPVAETKRHGVFRLSTMISAFAHRLYQRMPKKQNSKNSQSPAQPANFAENPPRSVHFSNIPTSIPDMSWQSNTSSSPQGWTNSAAYPAHPAQYSPANPLFHSQNHTTQNPYPSSYAYPYAQPGTPMQASAAAPNLYPHQQPGPPVVNVIYGQGQNLPILFLPSEPLRYTFPSGGPQWPTP